MTSIQILSLIGAAFQLSVFACLQTGKLHEGFIFSLGMTIGSGFLIAASIQNIEFIGFLVLELIWGFFSVLGLIKSIKTQKHKG